MNTLERKLELINTESLKHIAVYSMDSCSLILPLPLVDNVNSKSVEQINLEPVVINISSDIVKATNYYIFQYPTKNTNINYIRLKNRTQISIKGSAALGSPIDLAFDKINIIRGSNAPFLPVLLKPANKIYVTNSNIIRLFRLDYKLLLEYETKETSTEIKHYINLSLENLRKQQETVRHLGKIIRS